jgi:hypothetical protein
VNSEENFERILSSYYSDYLPPVEVVTDKFRAVAKNFLTLPMKLLLDLKFAQIEQDGSDLLLLFDACEMAFSENDFERLQDLNIKDFLNVVNAWVNWEGSSGGTVGP